MFEIIKNFFKKNKKEHQENPSKETAKERLHLVLMQDRANVSADFLELMKQEIIEVIKKYVDVDEKSIDVRLTNKSNDDGTTGAPALYANIPIVNVRNDMKKEVIKEDENKSEEQKEPEEKKDLEESKEEVPKEILQEAEEIIEESENKEQAIEKNDREDKEAEIENITKGDNNI